MEASTIVKTRESRNADLLQNMKRVGEMHGFLFHYRDNTVLGEESTSSGIAFAFHLFTEVTYGICKGESVCALR